MKNCCIYSVAILSLGAPLAHASTIANGGFEAETFGVFPGYIAGNGPITGWSSNANSNAGQNQAGGPFANNGAVPEGNNVAILQGNTSGTTTLSSVDGITGLVAGRTYNLTYRVNNRLVAGANDPNMGLEINGANVLRSRTSAVGASNPYKTVSVNFVATGPTASLTLTNESLADKTLLFDDFQVAEVTPNITVSAWNDDATSGIDSSLNYTHAVNLGSATGAMINGVPFIGVAGGNPSIPGSFSYNMGNSFANDANNITVGGSSTLANDFVFNNATPTLTLEGLTVGQLYRTSIFTVGFDSTTLGRASTITGPDGEMLTVDVNAFGNNNGARVDIEFVATATTEDIEVTALFDPSSFHTYAIANAELIPEPSSLSLLALSALGLGMRRRR